MAVTIFITDFSPRVQPDPNFYCRVRSDTDGTYWDEDSLAFIPLANASPNISFVESPPGTWSWTRDFTQVPDGFYSIELYDQSAHEVADEYHIFVKDGNNAAVVERTDVALNENTGGTDALRYVTGAGEAIGGATVRVYTSTDWQAQALANPVGVTITNASGRWMNPIFVPAGNTYVVQYHLPRYYGPDTVTVTV